MNPERSLPDDGYDFVVPYNIVDSRLYDDTDTKQHKVHRGEKVRKRSIRHYRHATSKWGAALEGFGPLWFAICISSGGLGIVLNSPFPYPGHWQVVLATILYIFEIVLFFIFMGLMIARWIVYPHVAVRRAMSDPDELGAYAIPPIALMTIASLTISQVSDGPWGHHAFTLVGYVAWWIGVAWVFLTALVVLSVLFYTGNQVDRVMTPVLFMAPVGLATAGAEAGFISIYGYGMSARLAVPQIIVGYFAVGIAFFMAIILYTIYFHRLLSSGWTIPAKRPGLFILIAPCGQLSTALQLLGESANQYMRFAQYKPSSVRPPQYGTFWTSETASGVDGSGILFSLLFLGFDYFWLCISIIGVMDMFIKRQATYTLTWWGVVFPVVTITTAMLELSDAMDSPTFRVLTSAFTVFIAIVYFVNLGFTLWGVAGGWLIFGQSQAEIEDCMMKKAEDEMADEGNRKHV